MKFPENAKAVSELPVGLLGYIFYPLSKRDVGNLPETEKLRLFETSKEKAGVFVNENIQSLKLKAKKYGFTYLQLHGEESPGYCREVKSSGLKVIKAFGAGGNFNFGETQEYEGSADFFLFDTKAEGRGGTGKKFDWKIIQEYTGETPFFLSGGIGPGDAEAIAKINHPKFYGIDLNSGFEDSPGLKNIEKLQTFINTLKQQTI